MKWDEESSKKAFKSLNRILAKCILQGERPILTQICEDAGIPHFQKRTNNKWFKRFRKRFDRAESKWFKSGGSDYKKLKAELELIELEGIRPTAWLLAQRTELGRVLQNSYTKDYPNNNKYYWRKKIITEIEESQIKWSINREKRRISGLKRVYDGQSSRELYEEFIEKTKPIEEYIKIRIKYEHMKVSIHLGAYMFKDYKNLEFLNPKAKLLLDAAIKLSYDYLARSSVTNESMLRRYLRLLEFVYENDLPIPIEPNEARYVIQQYRIYCLNAKTSPETNAINFNLTLTCLEYLYEDPEIHTTILKGIKRIKRNKKLNATSADVHEVEYAISYYYNFFMKVTDFVLENKSFPYKLTLNGVKTLLIPYINNRYAITQDLTFKTQTIFMYVDFKNGKLRTEKNMIHNFNVTHPKWNSKSDRSKVEFISSSKNKLKKYKAMINDANSEPLHVTRLELAQRAFKAFFMLLGAFTGMKDSELAAFEWPDDNKIESNKSNIMNLAVIKPRADYKEIHLNINRIGVPLFKKVLKLRKYLLQDHTCPKFFFKGYFENATYDNTLAQGTYGGQCISQHKVLHPNLPTIGTKKLRVYKNKMVLSITNGDIWLASASIGNSISTNSDHYQGEIEEKKDAELSNFVENMVRQCTEEENDIVTPQGKCEEHNNPEPINGNSTLNCNNPFDCFRCKHYFATTDQETIHKLISLQYIIKRLQRQRAFNDDHFNDVMDPIEKKIERILIVMAKKYNLGVVLNEITSLVFKKETLHPYWAFRLHHLFAIHQI